MSIGFFRMPKSDEWCVNTSRLMGVDSTDNESLTKAEMEGRKQVEEIFRFLKKYVPGCENAQLTASGSYVGIRESRHIRGEYRLTADDLLDAKVPEDSILVASNSVDVHGRFGPTSNEYIPIKGDYYGVPYRSLVPVRGRTASGGPLRQCRFHGGGRHPGDAPLHGHGPGGGLCGGSGGADRRGAEEHRYCRLTADPPGGGRIPAGRPVKIFQVFWTGPKQ